jgi:hypothetical protein
MKSAILVFSNALLIAATIGGTASAQSMPRYDMQGLCAATMQHVDTVQMCLNHEKLMRDVVMMGWNEHSIALRQQCTKRTAEDQWPSYLTLNSCLVGGNP